MEQGEEDYTEGQIITINSDIVKKGEEALIDIQIATAKKYPRNDVQIKRKLLAFIMSPENKNFAETCQYAVPRPGDDPVVGPSIHLARLVLQYYGNMRVASKVTNITDTHIFSTAHAWDLESNLAVSIEIMRGITKKEYKDGVPTGKRVKYNESLVGVTGNAANSISMRNAILSVIPKALVNEIYKAAQKVVIGDLSTEELFIAKREELINYVKGHFEVTDAEILNAIQRPSIASITRDDLLVLKGFVTAILENEATVENTFRPVAEKVRRKNRMSDQFNQEVKDNGSE